MAHFHEDTDPKAIFLKWGREHKQFGLVKLDKLDISRLPTGLSMWGGLVDTGLINGNKTWTELMSEHNQKWKVVVIPNVGHQGPYDLEASGTFLLNDCE